MAFVVAAFVMVPGRLRRGHYLSLNGYGIYELQNPCEYVNALENANPVSVSQSVVHVKTSRAPGGRGERPVPYV